LMKFKLSSDIWATSVGTQHEIIVAFLQGYNHMGTGPRDIAHLPWSSDLGKMEESMLKSLESKTYPYYTQICAPNYSKLLNVPANHDQRFYGMQYLPRRASTSHASISHLYGLWIGKSEINSWVGLRAYCHPCGS
jgi:hypothetical protein